MAVDRSLPRGSGQVPCHVHLLSKPEPRALELKVFSEVVKENQSEDASKEDRKEEEAMAPRRQTHSETVWINEDKCPLTHTGCRFYLPALHELIHFIASTCLAVV